MHERLALANRIAEMYRKATKKEKGTILDQFCETTSYSRTYASHLLTNWNKITLVRLDGKLLRLKAGKTHHQTYPPRRRTYDAEFQHAVVKLWELSDFMCGKRLKPFITIAEDFIRSHSQYAFTSAIWAKLHEVSCATLDRILTPQRKRYNLRGRSHTKPGSLLKQSIPIRTFTDWNEKHPGFLEIDLVGHDGGNARGDFCFTLTATDIATEWTEVRAIRNKAQKWTLTALDYIIQQLPFPVLGIDCDNGSEFINAHLKRYCENKQITFTRSRPYRKNDNCFVEQKNDIIVRRTAGYLRYDSEEELHVLNRMYTAVRLWVNFFHPSQQLIAKTRIGSKVKKVYDKAKTPYQRVIDSAHIDDAYKHELQRQFQAADLIKLQRTVEQCKGILQDMVTKKNQKELSF